MLSVGNPLLYVPLPQRLSVPFTLNLQSPQARGLGGWWPTLRWNGDQVLYDLSGYRGHGDIVNDTADIDYVRHEKLGTGLDFLNTNRQANGARVQTPATGVMSQGTLCAWVQPDIMPTGAVQLVSNADSANRLYMAMQETQFEIRLGSSSGGLRGSITAGQLTHVLITWRGGTGYLYQDGVQAGASYSYTGVVGTTSGYLYFGSYAASGGAYDGKMWDVRKYNRMLSDAEVFAIYSKYWELYQPLVPFQIGYIAAGGANYPIPYMWQQ